MKRLSILLLLLLFLTGCGAQPPAPDTTRQENKLISDMVNAYGKAPDTAWSTVSSKFSALESLNPQRGELWRGIMTYWKQTREDFPYHYGFLPEDLPRDDSLCLVVLGYQLNPDGSMAPELIQRLHTALTNAQQYPNAYVLCTGGGTAGKSDMTEAEAMAHWLMAEGVAENRLLVENCSMSTTENAIFSYALVEEKAPQLTAFAIITSDYHAGWGSVLFETQFRLAHADGAPERHVISNAVCSIENHGQYSFRLQSSGILAIAGLR